MEKQEQREKEAEEAINAINKKTGRNMPQAIATAVVLIAIILACLLISVDLFVYLVVLFMVLALWELRVDFATAGLHIAKVTFGSRLSLAVADKLSHTDAGARLESSFNHEQGEVRHSRLSHVAVSMFTVLYIPLLASCLIMPLTFNGHPVAHAIMLVFMPALSDTGGLFAGAWLGKHKLSPRISPKKSWEGLAGSILFAMAGSFVVMFCTYEPSVWTVRWWVPIVAGFMIGIAGTFGDLCASMLKRDIGIKDMGHLLKGHGGVMDRVDSILLCAPFVCVLLWATGM